MIERSHLSIIRAINKKGSLVGASEELCVTQSALSQSIKKLERMSSIVLWKKSGRNIYLTEAGLYLLDVAKRVLPQFDHVDSVLQKFSAGVKGTLRIGMECHPCYKWLLQIISPYLKQWKDVDVDVRKQFTFKGLAALYQYEIDILVTPDPFKRTGVTFYPVFDFEQVLVVSKDHPFAKKQWINPQEMSQQVLYTYPVENNRLDIFRDFMVPEKIIPKTHFHIEDTDILLQMVSSNRGVSSLPRWLVEESHEQFGVLPVSLGKKGLYKKIYLGVRTNDYCPTYFLAFLKMAGVSLDNK